MRWLLLPIFVVSTLVRGQTVTDVPVSTAPPVLGDTVSDLLGAAVLARGDFNGDGIADVAAGAPNADGSDGVLNAGKVYVVYGTPDDPRPLSDLAALPPGEGFALEGHLPDLFLGEVLEAADINGDGIDDLIASAPRAPDFNASFAPPNLGLVAVVFGRREPLPALINMASLVLETGGNSGLGFVLEGALLNGRTGSALAALGDVNGDGLDDLLIGSESGRAGIQSTPVRPTAYLLFGRDGSDAFPGLFKLVEFRPGLSDGSLGTYVQGEGDEDLFGRSVAGLGDVNGDGLADFAVGAPLASIDGEEGGAIYVIAGRSIYPDGVDLNAVAPEGLLLRVIGRAGEQSGATLASPGDMNGDGRRDLAIGAPAAGDVAGRVDVIHMPETLSGDLRLADGFPGFSITGADAERLGSALSAAGDVDGDGLADLLVGARDHPDGGRAWLVRGATDRVGEQPVAAAPATGRITAEAAGDSLGRAVSGGGDLDADGSSDLVVGAPLSDRGASNAGAVYRFLGRGEDAAPRQRGALSHAWYDRTAPGQGLLLEYGLRDGAPALFGAWYTFDGGEPLWLVSDLAPIPELGRSVTTPLFVTEGGRFGSAFDPALVRTETWGSVRITQTGCGTLLWEYERAADGATGRLVFVPVLGDLLGQPLCTSAGLNPAADVQRSRTIGTWWNPGRSGEGVIIDLEARGERPELFFSWFTYAGGRPLWLVGNGPYDPATRAAESLRVFSASGADFGPAFDPAAVRLQDRGTVTLRFPSCDRAVLDYRVDPGAGPDQGSIELQRFTGGLSALPCDDGF